MHLSAEQLIDLAEGTRSERDPGVAPHLADCAACQRQLADLRTTLASIPDDEVPEPSPLFWDHFQQRVREQIATEQDPTFARLKPRAPWILGEIAAFLRPRVVLPIAAAAVAVAVTVMLNSRVELPAVPVPAGSQQATSAPATESVPDGTSRVELLNDSLAENDPSLQLVADLTTGMDWATAGEAGLASAGSAEHAVAHLTPEELAELQRILRAELANSGV
jgi:hypothetical protein